MVMARVMVITNEKGGTSKSTTTFNLAWKEAETGKKVCIIDLDPQEANISFIAGVEKDSEMKTIMSYLREGEDIRKAVQFCNEKNPNLHIIPADLEVASLEKSDVRKMRKAIEELSQWYDVIYIDVPPSPGAAHAVSLSVATDVIVVLLPDVTSLAAVKGILGTIQAIRDNVNPELNIVGLLFNQFNNRTRLGKQVETMAQNMASQLGTTVMDTKIRSNVTISEAGAMHEGVTSYDSTSNGAADFNSLYYEVMAKVKG